MRWLEVRRHALTKKGDARGRGSHLSAEGVALARRTGAGTGPFELVVTSSAQRAVETAVAMGCAVDEAVELPSCYVPGVVDHHDQWRWELPYVRYVEVLAGSAELASVVAVHRQLWERVVRVVDDGSSALIVSHGGSIEPTLVACLPTGDHVAWGAAFAHCDGVRLGFQDGAFVSAQFSRAA